MRNVGGGDRIGPGIDRWSAGGNDTARTSPKGATDVSPGTTSGQADPSGGRVSDLVRGMIVDSQMANAAALIAAGADPANAGKGGAPPQGQPASSQQGLQGSPPASPSPQPGGPSAPGSQGQAPSGGSSSQAALPPAVKEAMSQLYEASAKTLQNGMTQLKTGLGALLEKMGLAAKPGDRSSDGSGTLGQAGQQIKAFQTVRADAAKTEAALHEALANSNKSPAADRSNVAERANVSRFFQAPGESAGSAKDLSETLKRAMEAEAGNDPAGAAFARRDAARRDQRLDDMKSALPADQNAPAQRGDDRGRVRDKKSLDLEDELGLDERDKHGVSWLAEAHDTEEAAKGQGLRHVDVLGDKVRCHGLLEDGSRCLRRAEEGTSYCREHATALHMPPADPEAGLDAKQASMEPELAGDVTAPDVPVFDPTDPATPVYDGNGSVTTD